RSRQRAQLAQRYGERHAEMIKVTTAIEDAERKLQSELTKLVEVARISYQAAVAEEDSLRATLDSQKQEALGANRKSIEYSVLQREVDSNQQIFDTLLQHTKETGLTAALRSKNVRIVDEAEVPTVAVEPRLRRELALGLAAALLLAVACTFLVDYLDDRIDSPAEIRQRLGVPFLGLIPAVSEDAEESALLNRQQDPLFAEVFKTIRTNILFSIAAEGPRTIVVTSASPHEGKTVVASNLAVALAQSGQRVLLVDADMRRPRLHEVVGIPQEPGLSNVLTANAQPSAAIRAGQVENLWVLPAGVIPPNPAELLGSQRYRVLLGSIDSFFDWIVVDSPPVLAVADASLLANEATGVIFVVATAQTARSNATAALEQLAHARARVLGAVLNKAQVGKHPYYYARYYRKQYSVYHMPAGVEGAA
ncbi:MAG: polysaccharide biosynthesis tyrosine autokinase, partial [Vicinamibacterales bacterium]